jgi:DNA gyrase subunit A
LQNLEVAASILDRALGTEHFAALQREIGVAPSYRMTEAQADAVVRLQLGQLAALERDEIFKEYNDLRTKIQGYEALLSDEQNIKALIKDDLRALRDRYGEERRTDITGEAPKLDFEDLIEEEQIAVTISHAQYLKRMPLTTFRTQHRGGKGVSGGRTREDDDFIEHFFVASTHDYLLCFTNHGQCYQLRVFEIPEASRTSPGRALANILSLKPEEQITSLIPVGSFEADRYLLMATRQGVVKKTALEEYQRPRQGGLIGIKLDEGDTLINVALTTPGDQVVLCTRHGMAIRFDEADARAMGRNTRGVKGITLREREGVMDEVVGMVVVDPDGYLLTVCEKGYGKRTPFGDNTVELDVGADAEEEPGDDIEEEVEGEDLPRESSALRYRKQKRGGSGVRDIRTTERNGLVVGVAAVRDSDDVMLITAGGMVNRTHVSEIRIVGRNTQGVRVMSLNDEDRIASIAIVAREENGEDSDEDGSEVEANGEESADEANE